MRLFLVRHASVTVHPERPAEEWHLSPGGRAAADALASEACWATLVRLYSSTEPKAIATAQRIASRNSLSLSIDVGLNDVGGRGWVEGDYRDVARRYLRGEPLEGWELPGAATDRTCSCIGEIIARHGEADVGIVSHGLVLTLYLSDQLGLDDDATVALWESMGLPDYAVIDVSERRLERPFRGGAPEAI